MNRRDFIKTCVVLGAVYQEMFYIQSALAKPRLVSESDPDALEIGYVHDSQTVSKKGVPYYKNGSKCSSCQHFQSEKNSGLGNCEMYFQDRLVKAEGWCAGWSAAR